MKKRELRRYHDLRMKAKACRLSDLFNTWTISRYYDWYGSKERIYLTSNEERYSYVDSSKEESRFHWKKNHNHLCSCSCYLCIWPKGTPSLQELKSLDSDFDSIKELLT